MDSGLTRRRHISVSVADIQPIGKEANEIEEDETFGADEDSTISYGLSPDAKARMIAVIAAAPKRKLMRTAGVSDHTIDKVTRGEGSDDLVRRLYEAALRMQGKGGAVDRKE